MVEHSAKHSHYDRTVIVMNTEAEPWIPYPGIEGSAFKLLRVDPTNGGTTLLIKIPAGISGPWHRHFCAAEFFVIEGEMPFDGEIVGPGTYVYEEGPFDHSEPAPTKDVILLFTNYGPVQAWDGEGENKTFRKVLEAADYVKMRDRHLASLSA